MRKGLKYLKRTIVGFYYMKNAIFIHAAILDKCKDRIIQYLDIIKDSKLINNVTVIYICFIGSEQIPISSNDISEYNNNLNI